MAKGYSHTQKSSHDISDNYVYQLSVFSYKSAAGFISGDVLVIGGDCGTGLEILSEAAKTVALVDDRECNFDMDRTPNVVYRRASFPPFKHIEAGAYNQIIVPDTLERVKDDFAFIREMSRILTPGGRLIISVPNKEMVIARNPWHRREYSVDEITNLLSNSFPIVEGYGVHGNERVMEYYKKNKKAVGIIMAFDVLHMSKWLPSWLLKIPYKFLNRFNRRRMLITNRKLTTSISEDDFSLTRDMSKALELFFVVSNGSQTDSQV